jgi:hypothetical protein
MTETSYLRMRAWVLETKLETRDDDLRKFEAEGAPALPAATAAGYVQHDGARI